MLIRRDKLGRSPWIAAGTNLGALTGFTVAPIQFGTGDTPISASWALGGAVVGLVVGIVLDIYKIGRGKKPKHRQGNKPKHSHANDVSNDAC